MTQIYFSFLSNFFFTKATKHISPTYVYVVSKPPNSCLDVKQLKYVCFK